MPDSRCIASTRHLAGGRASSTIKPATLSVHVEDTLQSLLIRQSDVSVWHRIQYRVVDADRWSRILRGKDGREVGILLPVISRAPLSPRLQLIRGRATLLQLHTHKRHDSNQIADSAMNCCLFADIMPCERP